MGKGKNKDLASKLYDVTIKADRFPKDVRLNAAGVKEVKSMPGCILSTFVYSLVFAFAVQKAREMINR